VTSWPSPAAETDLYPGVVVVVVILTARPPSVANCSSAMNDNRPTIRAITNDQVGRSAAVTLLENERSDASRCILRRRYSLYMIKLGTDSL